MNPAATVVVSDAVLSSLSIANRLLLFLYLNYLSCYVNCDVEFIVRSTMMSGMVNIKYRDNGTSVSYNARICNRKK